MEETAPSYSQQLSLFAYDESSPEPIARPRKRLIDVLGGGQDGPRKNSCSPFFSDGDPEGLEDGAVSLNQETSLNEATILSLQRSTTGGRGPRITYARERSYRMNDATSLEDMLNIPMDTPLTPHEPARKKIEEHIQPMEVEEEKPRTQIKNIHELRAAGEYNRFVDDVEDLFLDIEGGATIGQKRNGYFELANRLKDKTFNHKFRTNCFDERVLTKLDTQTDPIITFSLSYLTLLFLDLDSTPRTMIHLLTHSITTMLLRMLSSNKDILSIARDRSLNMSKLSQATLGDFRGHILHFLPETKARTLSPQILALKTIDNLIRAFRSRGGEEEVLPKSILRGLIEILAPFAEKKEFPKSLKLNGIALLELPISILEAYASGGYGSLETKISSEEMAVLSKLLVAVTDWQITTDVDLKPVKLLLLRVLINITNQHPTTCDAITDASLIVCLTTIIKEQFQLLSGKLEEQQRLFSVDYLILTLGLMMNLADFSEKARAVAEDAVAAAAAAKSESPNSDSFTIDILLQLFLSHHSRTIDAASIEESHTNVAFGYLTILLGTLCQDDHIRYHMRAKLPNGGIKLLLGAVEEFIRHHRRVDREIMGG
ncbi:wings apart-like protein regulation of heterochromatin-domain-containing protein [Pyronema domesticum]|nr:wings apart-like protein regulation of heterochromatin-domain-containing protein [Pyronema domesticum]